MPDIRIRATRGLACASALTFAFAGASAAQDLLFPVGEGDFSWEGYEAFAAENDFTGEAIEITGASTGEDGERLRNLYAYFSAATGADVLYTGSESFEQDIVIGSQAGSAPDLANFPQPGLARDLAGQGILLPLPDERADWVRENYAAGESWADLSRFKGPDGTEGNYGLFFGTDVKSLVWYNPETFEEAGYEVPETMEDLIALSDTIVEDGGTPWCIGLGSGAATGWPGTDWVEDIMLRTASTAVYDQWVSHEIPFDDPQVVNAIEIYGQFARNPDYTPQGPEGVASTDFRDSPDGLFAFPPECFLHKQASFIPFFFPEGTEIGVDADFFYFPPFAAETDLGRPVLGSGGLTARTNDRPVTEGFIRFLELPVAHEIMMAQGQFLTAHLGANLDVYTSATQRQLGEILTSATTFRFDGSDLMPGEIGTEAFWSGIVDYTTGADAADVAARIEERWQAIP